MRELEKKQKIRKRIYSTPVLVIFSLFVLFLLKGTYDVVAKMRSSQGYVRELQNKVATLEERRGELERDIGKLQTAEGVDSAIKSKFSVSKEGEHVAVIVDARMSEPTTTDKEGGFLTKIAKWISGLWQ